MSKFMNTTNVYWAPPQYTQTNLKPISGHVGFFLNLPYPDPVSTTATFGEGNENIFGKRELVFSEHPEMHAFGGVVPMTSGIPRVDPKGLAGSFNRGHYTIKI